MQKRTKTFNEIVAVYKAQLQEPDMQMAYEGLLKYLMKVKANFEKTSEFSYTCGNVSPGYLDYSYFPFSNDYLRTEKLRFGLVINHQKMRFELWLMGQNTEIQQRYWKILKDTAWNKDQPSMPKYSVLESILVDNPNFNDLDKLTREITAVCIQHCQEIMTYLEKIPDKNDKH